VQGGGPAWRPVPVAGAVAAPITPVVPDVAHWSALGDHALVIDATGGTERPFDILMRQWHALLACLMNKRPGYFRARWT